MPDGELPTAVWRTHVRLQGLLDQALDGSLSSDEARSALRELGTTLQELRVAEEELVTQAEQLAASAAAIDEERERYVELFELAPDAYLETDERGKIAEANRAAAELLGVSPRHLTGKLVVSYVDAPDRRRFRQLVREAVDGAVASEEVVTLRTRDQREVVAGVTVARQQSPALDHTQLRWLIRDITARTKLESQVEDLTEEVDLLVATLQVQRLAAEDPLSDTLSGLVGLAQRVLPRTQIGVSIVGRPDMERSLSTGHRAQELDLRQRQADDGPCIRALHTGELTRGRPADWPILADATDVAEVVAIPMLQSDQVDGALNVYSFDRPLSDHDMQLLEVLGRQAAVALQNAALYSASASLAANLDRALQTRSVIERAKGILMAQGDVDADQAFEVLKRASQRENVKLHEIAARIATARTTAL